MISWNRQMIGGSVHLPLASNVAKNRSFWRYSVIKICLFISFSTVFRMQYLVDNLFLLSCCIVEDPENASADTFYSDSLHVWSRNHSTTRHYCPTNQDTFLKQGISVLKALLFWQTFCQCYDSCPAYLNTIRFGAQISGCGQFSSS